MTTVTDSEAVEHINFMSKSIYEYGYTFIWLVFVSL